MKNIFFLITLITVTFLSCTSKKPISLETPALWLSLDDKGNITEFTDKASGTNFMASDTISPLMSIKINDGVFPPTEATISGDTIILTYQEGTKAKIVSKQMPTHITFTLTSISNNANIDLIIWGPYHTVIDNMIGETVGVVQGEEFAMGIQSLNPKTLGGYPWNDNDCMPQIDIFDQDDLSDMSEKGKRYVLYRVEAARPTNFGSSLQAYCRNRTSERIISNLNHEKYVSPSYDDGGTNGSAIALFGCNVEDALETIGEIEISEGLPHPEIEGNWGKTSPLASSAYMIMGFGENDIKTAIEITNKAGLKYLYHPGPFSSWGHFTLKKEQFPYGTESLKNCVVIANKNGIEVGLHTLSNFITTNDPYVAPVPDKRLAIVGTSTLTDNINSNQTEIPILSPDFFNQYKNNHLKTVRIDNELIRYGSVSDEIPYRLLDCKRAAFNTVASKHSKSIEIHKLTDHGYKVFLTNAELSIEVAETIADLYNYCGLRQISFDGLEGNRSTGMGNYGEILFADAWYNGINNEIRSNFIADASRTSHYFWHIYTRMNWGEPWYAGFRESQTEYRLKNQKYFKRNLMPGMLGWFKMTDETSIEDIEWLLARSAAFDAGYGFVTNYETIEKNGNSDTILKLIGEWEKLRINGLFTKDQKTRMEDLNNEFTLNKISNDEWELYQVYSGKFKHEYKIRQPGEPLYSTFAFNNLGQQQTLNFILSSVDADASEIKIEIDNFNEIILPIGLKKGESIKYSGGSYAYVYNNSWQLMNKFKIDPAVFNISQGNHTLTLDCRFINPGKESMIKFETRTFDKAEKITTSNNNIL